MNKAKSSFRVLTIICLFIFTCSSNTFQDNAEKNVSPWINLKVNQINSADWIKRGNNTIEKVGDYTKITIVDSPKGAILYLGKVLSAFKTADLKNYRIRFRAYVKGSNSAKIALRRLSYRRDTVKLLKPTLTEYIAMQPNLRIQEPYLTFDELSKGSVVYVDNNITVERLEKIKHKRPSFDMKGIVIDMGRQYARAQSDIDQIMADASAIGVKFVRLQVSPESGMEGLSKVKYLDSVVDRIKRQYIPLLEKYKMNAMVCYEGIPFNSIALNSRHNKGYWRNSKTKQNFIDTAKSISQGLANEQRIVAFQFMAEPINSENRIPENWREISIATLKEVRKYTDKYFVWTGGPYGMTIGEILVPLEDDKVIYNFHGYSPGVYTHQGIGTRPYPVPYTFGQMDMLIQSMIDFSERNNNAPILCGAYALANYIQDADLWLGAFYDKMKKYNIPAIRFTLGQYKPWDPRLIGTKKKDGSNAFVKDTTKNNKQWFMLQEYLKYSD